MTYEPSGTDEKFQTEYTDPEDSFLSLFEDDKPNVSENEPSPEPEPQPGRSGKIVRIIAITISVTAIIMCIISIAIFIKRKIGKKKSEPAGFATKEEAVDELFKALSNHDVDGIKSCFPDRDILSDKESRKMDLTISTLSKDQNDYDRQSLQMTFDNADVHFLFEKDINVDYEAAGCRAEIEAGAESLSYSMYLIKTDNWYILEVSGNKEAATEDPTEDITEEAGTEASTEEAADRSKFATGKIMINLKYYTMPFKYSDLEGFTLDKGTKIQANGRGYMGLMTMDMEPLDVTFTVSELDGKDTNSTNCKVTGLTAKKSSESKFNLVLPGGGAWNKTPKDIKKIYGEPDFVTEDGSGETYKYEIEITDNEKFNECIIVFQFNNGEMIEMQYGLY